MYTIRSKPRKAKVLFKNYNYKEIGKHFSVIIVQLSVIEYGTYYKKIERFSFLYSLVLRDKTLVWMHLKES